MNATPHLSEAEWEVMKAIWRREPEPSIAPQLVAELGGPKGWSEATVKTLLNRLLKKKALRFEKVGKAYLYSPAVTEEQCRSVASDSFLNRVFDGSLSPLLAHFVSSRKLSAAELNELEQLLGKSRIKMRSEEK